MMPNPVRLFHITALTNLNNICCQGALISKNKVGHHGINYQNIAHAGAQSSRSHRAVLNPPGGLLHDYVPFYFAPRSPMLSAIHNKKVSGCSLNQEDIIYFETTVEQLVNSSLEFIFYDMNATLVFSNAYTDLGLLSSVIAWDLITEPPTLDGYCKYFHDIQADPKYVNRRARRQAEFIVKDLIPLNCFNRIGVINCSVKNQVNRILLTHGLTLKVDVMTDWYFLGQ
ncbi:TPA: DUF4433 domain-containing protein [Legionella pneumophila]|uniref:type II toxin-antitoxin system toxin DNA ADP-ribosyl transferase DarT n=1 Tax=Legionella pneumophila TaxID=446 RepID=UPI0004B3DEAB|nr:DUF4433 domain-containing protein [Legionella pneumophila]HAT9229007.1 DUF4433 domain-containing protein [Legionella pneumophila subsp. pneumophila]MCZ4736315.1 DUF4433 domain-containing protein [Legionella pneumophila]MDW9179739.1 DUF4433 domain-containing protein [Legionella pneumophila]CZL83685.1 Uncharacterised protein [Legionella pneumophila]HAT9925405.1 DUF4433 domain-containing protein [Legionella pneumophila subsp. pneumophila]